MNLILREQIVRHVFANLGIVFSPFVNLDKSKSLASQDYLLPEKLSFQDSEGKDIQNKVWGCQISVDKSEVKMLLADCSQDKDLPVYALLIQMKDAPAYGLYLVYSDHLPAENQVDSEATIAFSMDGKSWMECGTYLQATFLAGMEQLRDIGIGWNKCANYQAQFESLQSFLKFQSNLQGDDDEGQEN